MENKYKTFEDFMDGSNDPIEDLANANSVLGDEYAYVDLNPSTIEDQKFIANFYETSLGHIQLIDPVKHMYSVTTEEREDIKVIIYSDDNATIIKENAYNYFMKSLEEPMMEVNYPLIESVGRINLFAYLNTEVLESNFKLKFKLDVFLSQKNEYKFIRVEENYYVFEL
jgi:hypothetical protein